MSHTTFISKGSRKKVPPPLVQKKLFSLIVFTPLLLLVVGPLVEELFFRFPKTAPISLYLLKDSVWDIKSI